MDFVIILLAIIGFFWLVNFLYRGYRGSRKFRYMNDLIKRYNNAPKILDALMSEGSTNRLFNNNPSSIDTIPTDIYKWCMSHSPERDICERHRAKKEDFDNIFEILCISCPFTVKGFFIPIAAFFFYPTLDYILKNKDTLNSRQALNDLCSYFEKQ